MYIRLMNPVRIAAPIIAFGLLTCIPGFSAAASSDASATLVTHSVLVRPPLGGANPAVAELLGVACPPRGGCWGVGDYQIAGEKTRPMVVERSSGRWQVAVPIALPSVADPTGFASLSAISCTSSRSCVAVGTYSSRSVGPTSGSEEPMAVLEVSGHWGRALAIVPPSDALRGIVGSGSATAVECVGSDTCTILGTYANRSNVQREFRATEVTKAPEGALSRATALPFRELTGLYAGAQSISLEGLACTSLGNCISVGSVSTGDGSNSVAVTESEERGRWTPETVAPLPSNVTAKTSNSWLYGVACPQAVTCIATGTVQYSAKNDDTGALIEALSGQTWTWHSAPPSPRGHSILLDAVSCATRLLCSAVGGLIVGSTSFTGTSKALVALGDASGLTSNVSVPLPNGGPGAADSNILRSVACTRTGSCTAVGSESLSGATSLSFDHPVATEFNLR